MRNTRFYICPNCHNIAEMGYDPLFGARPVKRAIQNLLLNVLSTKILGMEIDPAGAMEIASRSRGTPRIANRLLKRVRDIAQVEYNGEITEEVAQSALARFEIDELGLDDFDRRMLTAIINNYGGGPVGLETLAATVGEEAITLEDVYEPFLLQIGFLSRTPRGRCVTKKAYDHLGIPFEGQLEL